MRGKQSFRLSLLLLLSATPVLAQDSVTPPQLQQSSRPETELRQGPQEGRGRGVAGKITAIKGGALELERMDGGNVTIKLSDKTEYRKDRQSAKLQDFKVGDMVFIRTEGAGDQDLTALVVAGRTGNGPGMGGPGGCLMMRSCGTGAYSLSGSAPSSPTSNGRPAMTRRRAAGCSLRTSRSWPSA